jgi:hypothetical protein
VRLDLLRNKAAFAAHGLPAPTLFAYPFSAATGPTNDPQVISILQHLIGSAFKAAMVNEYGVGSTRPDAVARRELSRIEVVARTTFGQFAARIARASPVGIASAPHPLLDPAGWTDLLGRPLGQAPSGGRLVLAPKAGGWASATYLRDRTAFWSSYRVRVRVDSLGSSPAARADGEVGLLLGTPNQLQVTVSNTWLSIRRGSGAGATTLLDRPIAPAPPHLLDVRAARGRVLVILDGRIVYWRPSPRSAASRPRRHPHRRPQPTQPRPDLLGAVGHKGTGLRMVSKPEMNS